MHFRKFWGGNIIVVEESMSKIYLKECRGDKENCLKQFYTHQPNKQYCDSRCRYNSILESNRKSRKKYYQNNKKKSILSQLGTTTLSKHPNPDFEREEEIIKNEKKRTFHTTKYKKALTNNNIWIDNTQTLEYGESQPCGIQNTHNYATFDDYYHTSKHYLLKDKGKCPECGCPDNYKTDIDVSCAFCGLILEGNPKLMGWTHKDVIDSQIGDVTVQEIAWTKYWKGE